MIKENLRFLGYTPFTTTHASDNFGKLYEYAVKLIEKGKAYCCFLSKEEVIYNMNLVIQIKIRSETFTIQRNTNH